MDAQVLTHPGAASPEIGRPDAFLPGEEEQGIAPELPPPSETIKTPPRKRTRLLAGVCLAIVLVAAGGVFLISPYNHILAVPAGVRTAAHQAAASVGLKIDGLVAPAATLATAPQPTPAPPPIRSTVVIPPKDAQLREMLAYRGLTPGQPEKPAPAPALPSSAGLEVGMAPVAAVSAVKPPATATTVQQPSALATVVAEPSQPPAPVTVAPNHVQALPATSPAPLSSGSDQAGSAAGPKPGEIPTPDAVTVATHMRAAEMTEPQQIQVLALVTQLGTLIRDQRTEIAALRADQERTGSMVDAKLADYDRRLSLAEAKGAINAAMGAAVSSVQAAAATPTDQQPAAHDQPIQLVTAAARVPATTRSAPAVAEGSRRYRVQAASPNLAMLAALDRSGDDGAQLQVAIGDDVPGFGKVVSISQRGTTWIVQTDHGAIQ